MRLVIGNKNYSSWSLRPWILLRHGHIRFDEVRIPLFTSQGEQMIEDLCPAGKVPVLYDDRLVLWDSFAICEYIADKHPAKKLWPEDAQQRARARAMSSEMHSGFDDLRSKMPMNCRRVVEGFEPDNATKMDINRIIQLWDNALSVSGGPWLFGKYSVADAMFAPVASRFKTYDITLPAIAQRYADDVLADKPMQRWYEDAQHEAEVIDAAEI